MAPKQENGIGNSHVTEDPKEAQHDKETPAQTEIQPFLKRIRSWRWMTAMITWFGFINATLMRNSFNMALVCMTGSAPPPRKGDNSSYNMGINNSSNVSMTSAIIGLYPMYFETVDFLGLDPTQGEFDWDEQTQGIILSSVLYFGFLAPAISGVLSKKFGAKRIVGVSITISSIMHLLTPFGARLHLYVLIAMRIVIGCFSGTILPATQSLWSHWAPDQEKVQLVSWTLSGVNIGSLVSSLISGFLCLIPVDNGWPFVFYVFGGISIIWCIMWWILVYDTPDRHPWITEKEKRYIMDNIRTKPDNSTFIPYKAVITSVPMWAFVFIQTVHMWCATIFFTYLPKYMRDILRFPIEQNAVVSSVPFAFRFVGVIFWGVMADQMARRHVSTTVNRKVVQSAGFLTCAAMTVGIGFISEDKKIFGVVLFIITMFFQSCTFAASSIIPLDMAPRLASVITGVFLGAGGFVAIFAPITVSKITPNGTLEEWRLVFFMLVGCYVVGVTVFVIFGSAELQPWGKILPVNNIVSEPSTNNLVQLDKTTQDGACANGDVSHDEEIIRKRPPRVLIEREVSVISTDSIRSIKSYIKNPNKSNPPQSPILKVTSVYFHGEDEFEGNFNYGFVDEERITTDVVSVGGEEIISTDVDVIRSENTNDGEVNIWYAHFEDISIRNEEDEMTRL